MSDAYQPTNAAEALLMRLKMNGVDYMFANAGTDFAPVIEGYAATASDNVPMPAPMVIPHETAAVGMAHGYYLATGKPQSVMVHVNVGLANSLMGILNAWSDQVPLFMMSGRTPLTEFDRLGSRMTPIQYGQEMRDQAGMLREATKWDYELRFAEQIPSLVDRGMAIAMSDPKGPVFLGLPREPLAEAWPEGLAIDGPLQAVPTAGQPDGDAVDQAAEMLSGAKNPLIICQRSDPAGRISTAVSELAEKNAIPVVEFLATQNNLRSDHPMHGGYDVGPWIGEADVILVVHAQVPWIQRNHQLADDAKVIHVGPDPLFSKMPVRSFRNSLAIAADAASAVSAITASMNGASANGRYDEIKARNEARRADMLDRAAQGGGSPMSPPFVSKCLSDALDDDSVVCSELGVAAPFMDFKGPNRFYNPPFSGGLGWGMPAALGMSLANPDRIAVACVGDGSYMFANPVACHQIAEAHDLPLLTVIMNNGIWNAVRRAALNVYPDGEAARMNVLPITSLEPMPDFCQIAQASRAHAERVEDGKDLPAALKRAIDVIKTEKRQALVEVRVSVPN